MVEGPAVGGRESESVRLVSLSTDEQLLTIEASPSSAPGFFFFDFFAFFF